MGLGQLTTKLRRCGLSTETVNAENKHPAARRFRSRLQRMVGCLRGITWAIRIVVMLEFTIRMMVSLTLGKYADAAWELAVVVALCPAWDETANRSCHKTVEEGYSCC